MSENQLKDVLAELAGNARPARIAPDTWPRGRRKRRISVATTVLAVAVVLAGSAALIERPGDSDLAPAQPPRPIVPSVVYPPFTGEDTIVETPPGPAAILISGDQELRGSDIWGWEGRSLVVGQNGSYRLARTVGETTAGAGGLILSPDGRYIATVPWIEGTSWPSDIKPYSAVFDLTTGETKLYPGGSPILFSPDGKSLLVSMSQSIDSANDAGLLGLLDLGTGEIHELGEFVGKVRVGNYAAFSPDGSRIAVATHDALYVIDVATATNRKLADLTARDRLAGPGAWLPDGRRLAMYYVGGCEIGHCDENALRSRLFQVEYRDAQTGAPSYGPKLSPAQGLAARLLAWQGDGDAVVAVYQPETGAVKSPDDAYWSETDWWKVGSVELKEFRPDGSQHELVDLPSSALFVEVPTNLMDSFGGPAPSWLEGSARRVLAVYWPVGQFGIGLLVLIAAIIALPVWRRRKRSGTKTATREA